MIPHKRYFWCFFFSLYSLVISAQDRQQWEKYYSELTQTESVSDETTQDSYEILGNLADSPIDLNHATDEDLDQFIFLTDQQREELAEYLYKYAPLRSLGELAMIESLDPLRRQLLSCFVYLGEEQKADFPTMKNMLKYGRNEILTAASIPFYKRKGDKNGYLGYPYRHWLKYNFTFGQYVKLGFIGSQDAGEPFFANKNRMGYDYYSFYFQLKNYRKLKSFVIGRYRLKFGMGIHINNDFSFGKLGTLATLNSTTNTIRAHSSKMEGNYLQGTAGTIKLSDAFELTGFVSYRHIDATLNQDSTTFSAIITGGYHRTLSEMAHKHNIEEFLGGGHLGFNSHGFHAGITASHTAFSKELRPDKEQVFREHYPSGKSFSSISIDYGYLSGRFSIQGETATGNSKAIATINSASVQLNPNLSLLLLQRFYSYRYYALFSRSFSSGGRIQNESGLFFGINWAPAARLTLKTYTDFAYFPWAKYQISQASHSWDNFLSAVYSLGNISVCGRYRLQFRQQDNEDKTGLSDEMTQRGRLYVSFSNAKWWLKTQADIAFSNHQAGSSGMMFSQNAGFHTDKWQLYATIGYFKTDDFNSRIYLYERGLLYSFAFPMFYGHGVRFAFSIRTDFNSRLMAMGKIGTTAYFDRRQIGNSYQMIDNNAKTDLELQLRWKF